MALMRISFLVDTEGDPSDLLDAMHNNSDEIVKMLEAEARDDCEIDFDSITVEDSGLMRAD